MKDAVFEEIDDDDYICTLSSATVIAVHGQIQSMFKMQGKSWTVL